MFVRTKDNLIYELKDKTYINSTNGTTLYETIDSKHYITTDRILMLEDNIDKLVDEIIAYPKEPSTLDDILILKRTFAEDEKAKTPFKECSLDDQSGWQMRCSEWLETYNLLGAIFVKKENGINIISVAKMNDKGDWELC